jgi:DNA (cytosine-5)-methyltransferase 1
MKNMKELSVVSLFSGAGGLDIGLERAGFKTLALSELEPNYAETLRQNSGQLRSDGRSYLTDTRIIQADIRDLSGRDLAAGASVDCLIGGPPCQSFSSSGKQLSILDPRGSLVADFIRMVDEIRPASFIFENVRGIVTARDPAGKPGGVIRQIYAALEELGYSCRASLLNAADYGASQRRVRCFIIGVRAGQAPEFPYPTHEDAVGATHSLFAQPWRTLGEFLEQYADPDPQNYVFPTAHLSSELEPLPDGAGLKSRGNAEPTRPGGHWGYRQGTFIADKTLPARTVTGSSSQDWVRWQGVLRRLTLLEVKRLQGFPDDWIICGNKSDRFKQIGNAVPTVFGQVLGETLRDYLHKAAAKAATKRIPFPKQFEGYIAYTERDHARNSSARKIHLRFEQ